MAQDVISTKDVNWAFQVRDGRVEIEQLRLRDLPLQWQGTSADSDHCDRLGLLKRLQISWRKNRRRMQNASRNGWLSVRPHHIRVVLDEQPVILIIKAINSVRPLRTPPIEIPRFWESRA